MKKTLLIVGISAALFSCKKQTTKEFEATDLTGQSTLKGNISKPVFRTGGATHNEPAAGVEVSVRVNNNELYPNNSNAQGAKNYYGTTDANGNYVVNPVVNQSGVNALVTVPDMVSTLDTVINGTRRTGFLTQFIGNGGNNLTLTSGTETNFSFTYNYTTLGGNPGNLYIGDAWITGWVTYQTVRAYTSPSGSLTTLGNYSVAAGNTPVWLTYNVDPTTGTVRTYSVTTDVAGKYTFTVTASANTPGTATLKLPDYIHTMDTTVYSNASFTTITTPAKTGKAGFYGDFMPPVQSGIFAKEFRYVNANYTLFTAF